MSDTDSTRATDSPVTTPRRSARLAGIRADPHPMADHFQRRAAYTQVEESPMDICGSVALIVGSFVLVSWVLFNGVVPAAHFLN